jgi:hypothetical protein
MFKWACTVSLRMKPTEQAPKPRRTYSEQEVARWRVTVARLRDAGLSERLAILRTAGKYGASESVVYRWLHPGYLCGA